MDSTTLQQKKKEINGKRNSKMIFQIKESATTRGYIAS
jgi:hypothetical protein